MGDLRGQAPGPKPQLRGSRKPPEIHHRDHDGRREGLDSNPCGTETNRGAAGCSPNPPGPPDFQHLDETQAKVKVYGVSGRQCNGLPKGPRKPGLLGFSSSAILPTQVKRRQSAARCNLAIPFSATVQPQQGKTNLRCSDWQSYLVPTHASNLRFRASGHDRPRTKSGTVSSTKLPKLWGTHSASIGASKALGT